MRKAVAFTGPSNSGKTTLIEKLVAALSGSYRVAVVKNDPKDKGKFDTEGKDSHKFFSAGADVAVVSPTRTTYFSHRSKTLKEVVDLFGSFDFLFVEGLKHLALPRIGIFRGSVDESYYPYIKAVAIDGTIDAATIPEGLAVLDLNDTESVIRWIDVNAKEV